MALGLVAPLRETLFFFHAETRRGEEYAAALESCSNLIGFDGDFAGDVHRSPGLELSLRLSLRPDSAVPHWFTHLILLEIKR